MRSEEAGRPKACKACGSIVSLDSLTACQAQGGVVKSGILRVTASFLDRRRVAPRRPTDTRAPQLHEILLAYALCVSDASLTSSACGAGACSALHSLVGRARAPAASGPSACCRQQWRGASGAAGQCQSPRRQTPARCARPAVRSCCYKFCFFNLLRCGTQRSCLSRGTGCQQAHVFPASPLQPCPASLV